LDNPDPDPYASVLTLLSSNLFLGEHTVFLISLFVLMLLLFAAAMLTGSEKAFFTLQSDDIDELNESESKSDQLVLRLREEPKKLLATMYIAKTLIISVTIILSLVCGGFLIDIPDNAVAGLLVQFIVVTFLVLIVGELLPRIFLGKNARRFASSMACPMALLVTLLKPFSNLLASNGNYIDKRLSQKMHNFSIDDLETAIDSSCDETTPSEEKKMLKGIVTFNEIEARSIMKSRVDISAVAIDIDFSELISVVANSGFSRIPVYEGSYDKIVGILYIKDLLPYFGSKKLDWQALIRPAFFVPENKKINDLLQEFRSKKNHLAIVVDEYGGTSGLITLEDIIEEIVGEIKDEYDDDSDESFYNKIDEQTYIFEARTNLIDFCKVMHINEHYFENVQGESDTLSGLLLEKESKIPQIGDKITIRQFVFEVIDADQRRIKQIKVMRSEKNDET
jgi:gliding motility-associated protein GldE